MTKPNPTMLISEFLPLLREAAFADAMSYHRVWTLASRGKLPGIVQVNGKWLVDVAYASDIAAALGLTLRPVKQPRRAKASV